MSREVKYRVSEQRSRNMSAIKSKNTKPEIAVRKSSPEIDKSIGIIKKIDKKEKINIITEFIK